ncbi:MULTISPECIES: DNA polymerase III subunit delta [Pseudoalteromonas]|jgi:DNA polymerase-3 subunit delta|uniref:DNA polymerase III subunit delta n=1 Tax=Pseudoalteromonas lipolytica TaxID=570156 RepID=A0AAD0S023_9GAMM|nr:MULTISPECIES: DNA polymerase III subunit delta [Pseudoalteromonas]AXV65670.1 DNA polymerase III subunit delta [Pseudoalteromonas donghaensis]MBE0350008.1 DNA polymerase III subunit delta [Pseudoalteromonas lipolytica LMEB 39]MCC9659180.1 DNA polymerase III subunit delta [Pseudoalteromonas sp. MB41]QLJ07208.1 DNA polymerase III subunit delta [Pseudoalteromonas sp. JSTW]QPL41844.1 DNA polymerase III subunit delta [Pseudoalteromonas sp. A41-2]|tara:strand:+ start:3016 stop:4056 length:1041 start_codon:yes stop_codon:yes gene_type:complete
MRCYANQLTSQLKKGLAPFYMVFGEEPYQIAECVSQIRQAAKQHGFDEVIKFTLMQGFDWQEIIAQYQSMSLFSARTLIEFDLNEQKPGTTGSQIFKQLTELVNDDTILVLKGAKASQDIQRSAWFKALDKQGIFVPCYPLTGNHLTRWLDEQCYRLNLNLHNNAKQSLIEATEGNLLACHQELEKLSLLYGSDLVDQQAVMQGLLNQSKFDIFDLSDALLKGHAEQAVKVMTKLAADNTEAMSIFWAINKEASNLLAMQHARLTGANMTDLYKQFNIWKNQQATIQHALNRLNSKVLEQIIKQLAQFDAAYKQGNLIAPYQALTHICLVFCQPLSIPLPCHPHSD